MTTHIMEPSYMPHAACWLWDYVLILLHAPADLGTWFYYMFVPCIAVKIYRSGRLYRLRAAYPRLWVRGMAFIAFCGISHLGGFAEIWVGGWMYYVTGVNKVFMLLASHLFASEFYRLRNELILIGRILERAEGMERDLK